MPLSASSVSGPVLRATLPASWDENWYSLPAVFDLDKDGSNEIVAARHSVLYVWKANGALLPGWPQIADRSDANKNDYGGYNQNIGIAATACGR
jgi:hypothetical protein